MKSILGLLISVLLSLTFIGQPGLSQEAKKKRAIAPDFAKVFGVAEAVVGDQGWTDGIVMNKKGELWLKKSSELERFQSKTAPYFVSKDTDGWYLWVTPGLRLRALPDQVITDLIASDALVDIVDLEDKLLKKTTGGP